MTGFKVNKGSHNNNKMVSARDFGLATSTATQIYYANLSLHYYNRDPDSFEVESAMLELAKEYRDKVLGAAGSKPATEFVENFLGRPFSPDAYIKKLRSL